MQKQGARCKVVGMTGPFSLLESRFVDSIMWLPSTACQLMLEQTDWIRGEWKTDAENFDVKRH